VIPVEVTTDRAPAYPRVLDELIPSALHTVERYASNPVEADHGRLKARLRPMRGLQRHRSARILAAGHAFVQNLRRGRYGIATHVPRVSPAPHCLRRARRNDLTGPQVSAPACPGIAQRNSADSRSQDAARLVWRKTNRRHMTGDHQGREAERATLLVRAMEEILGTHRVGRARPEEDGLFPG
jgi:hypothetical protein